MVFLGALLIMSIIAWIFCIRNLYLEWQESARQNSINRLDLTAPQDTPVVVKVPQSEPAQIQNYVTTEETPLLPRDAIRNKRRRSEPAQMQSFVNSESTPLMHREIRRVRRQEGKSNLLCVNTGKKEMTRPFGPRSLRFSLSVTHVTATC